MDDISEKLNRLLASPDLMEQVQKMIGAVDKPEDGGTTQSEESAPLPALAKIAPFLSGSVKDDNHARLLKSLRPYLSADRAERLDEALGILRIMRLVPLISTFGKENES